MHLRTARRHGIESVQGSRPHGRESVGFVGQQTEQPDASRFRKAKQGQNTLSCIDAGDDGIGQPFRREYGDIGQSD